MTDSHTLPDLNCLIHSQLILNVSGLLCPLPVLKTKVGLQQIQPGEVIKILCCDLVAKNELYLFAAANGHSVLDSQLTDSGWVLWLQK
jgi:tRNA 2-thiouridine synthesizing protein A